MLVLSRGKSEEIVIGDGEIIIQIVEIRGNKVRLGITASDEIPVHRREVWETIKREGKVVVSAANAKPTT